MSTRAAYTFPLALVQALIIFDIGSVITTQAVSLVRGAGAKSCGTPSYQDGSWKGLNPRTRGRQLSGCRCLGLMQRASKGVVMLIIGLVVKHQCPERQKRRSTVAAIRWLGQRATCRLPCKEFKCVILRALRREKTNPASLSVSITKRHLHLMTETNIPRSFSCSCQIFKAGSRKG